MTATPGITWNGFGRRRIRHHPTKGAAPAGRAERERPRRLVLSFVAALVALASSFALGALGIPFGLLVARGGATLARWASSHLPRMAGVFGRWDIADE